MNTSTLLSSVMVLGSLMAAAQADLTVTIPAPAQAIAPQGNCDFLASNTVRATFKGVQDVPVAAYNFAQPTTAQVAVFEVIENLAHKRLSRYGDGAMPMGMTFTVALDRQMPGQPSDVVDTISKMNPGEEAVMRIDHLFLYGQPDGKFIRPCGRMAYMPNPRPNASEGALAGEDYAGADKPIDISTIATPNNGWTGVQKSEQVRSTSDGLGGYVTERIVREKSFNNGQVTETVHMYINGLEVDPQTRQPLNNSITPSAPTPTPAPQPAATPAPAPAPAPAVAPAPQPAPEAQPSAAPTPAAVDAPNDDTIIESESF